MKSVILALCLMLVGVSGITLAWDPNTEPDVVGYRLYYSTTSGRYSTNQMVEVMGLTNTVVSIPTERIALDKTNYFVVTAFNSSGLESDHSNEVSFYPPDKKPTQVKEVQISR